MLLSHFSAKRYPLNLDRCQYRFLQIFCSFRILSSFASKMPAWQLGSWALLDWLRGFEACFRLCGTSTLFLIKIGSVSAEEDRDFYLNDRWTLLLGHCFRRSWIHLHLTTFGSFWILQEYFLCVHSNSDCRKFPWSRGLTLYLFCLECPRHESPRLWCIVASWVYSGEMKRSQTALWLDWTN